MNILIESNLTLTSFLSKNTLHVKVEMFVFSHLNIFLLHFRNVIKLLHRTRHLITSRISIWNYNLLVRITYLLEPVSQMAQNSIPCEINLQQLHSRRQPISVPAWVSAAVLPGLAFSRPKNKIWPFFIGWLQNF